MSDIYRESDCESIDDLKRQIDDLKQDNARLSNKSKKMSKFHDWLANGIMILGAAVVLTVPGVVIARCNARQAEQNTAMEEATFKAASAWNKINTYKGTQGDIWCSFEEAKESGVLEEDTLVHCKVYYESYAMMRLMDCSPKSGKCYFRGDFDTPIHLNEQ